MKFFIVFVFFFSFTTAKDGASLVLNKKVPMQQCHVCFGTAFSQEEGLIVCLTCGTQGEVREKEERGGGES